MVFLDGHLGESATGDVYLLDNVALRQLVPALDALRRLREPAREKSLCGQLAGWRRFMFRFHPVYGDHAPLGRIVFDLKGDSMRVLAVTVTGEGYRDAEERARRYTLNPESVWVAKATGDHGARRSSCKGTLAALLGFA